MIILKEFDKIKTELQHRTALTVTSLSVDTEDGELIIWATLYNSREDVAYMLSVKESINVLLQFQNERILKTLVDRLINEWAEVARDNSTIH